MKQQALGRWADFIAHNATVIAVLALAIGGIAFWYTLTHVRINTDTTDMLSDELEFRINDETMRREFPQTSGLIVIVAEAENASTLGQAGDALTAKLREKPAVFGPVFDPSSDIFFRTNGLLYKDFQELDHLTERLAEAQPFIAGLNQNPNFHGLAGVLKIVHTADARDLEQLIENLEPLISDLATALATPDGRVDWQTRFEGRQNASEGNKPHRHIITIKPPTDQASLSPAADAIKALDQLVLELEASHPGVDIRLTGTVVLAEDELKSVAEGMGLAGLLAATLVIIVLYFGMRSVRLALAMMLTLAFGLVLTAAFAVAALPALNLISVAFAVLFVGLSVDFGIHLIMRFREAYGTTKTTEAGLKIALSAVGPAIALGALTSAIGFLSFLPTAYLGLAELGLIAGVGMAVALVANMTLLPALIHLMPPRHRPIIQLPWVTMTVDQNANLRHDRYVVFGALLLGVVCLGIATQARFDFDPINLQDQNRQSVQTLKSLMDDQNLHPYRIRILSDNLDEAQAISKALEPLPEVRSARTLADLIPDQQQEKLDLLLDLDFMIGPSLIRTEKPVTDGNIRQQAIIDIQSALDRIAVVAGPTHPITNESQRLRMGLMRLSDDKARAEAEERLFSGLEPLFNHLRLAMTAWEFSIDDLPENIRDRYLTPSGAAKIVVTPTGDMNDPKAVRLFAEAVQTIVPHATGTPIIITEASKAVITAFWQAGLIAITAIIIVLAMTLRSPRRIAIVFAPLFLAALVTVALTVIFGLRFNFANVIVLPLLFGLGIDAAIHMVLRAEEGAGIENLEATSTPKAIVFSFLTTIGSFGAIALSSHPGTASMGLILAIAIGVTLITTLVLIPRLLRLFPSPQQRLRSH